MNRKDEFTAMRLQGLTYQEIADQFHITRQRVHQILTGYKSVLSEAAKAKKKGSRREYLLKYRQKKGKDWQRERNRYFSNRIKDIVLTHYGNGKLECVKCGFNDIRALSIDHINGNGSKHRKELNIMGTSLYRKLAKDGYPIEYQTLCMNCQWIKKVENKEYGDSRERSKNQPIMSIKNISPKALDKHNIIVYYRH
jgi:predicted DNA-binding protein YlxM (UPF0122 family)